MPSLAGNGNGVGFTSSALGMGVAALVVVKGGAVILKLAHSDDHATLPYWASESVGDAMLAHVVVVWFATRCARLANGGAYTVVLVGFGRGVAYSRV
jgi:hypothetical protein